MSAEQFAERDKMWREFLRQEEILCVLVHYVETGEEIWEPARDYRHNPKPGTYLVVNGRKVRTLQ